MAYAYYRLEHTAVNRKDKGNGYMAAAANYAANDNKCAKIISVNFPMNRYGIRDTIEAIEASISRQNANLGHKVLISFPNEMSEAHRELAMRRFLERVTDGKSYGAAFFHDNKTNNPHAHVIIIDRDRETGKSVAKLSTNWTRRAKDGLEPNPTEWLRMMWEESGNSVLEEYGYESRLDRRTNLERGLEPAGQHRGSEEQDMAKSPEDELVGRLSSDEQRILEEMGGEAEEIDREEVEEQHPNPNEVKAAAELFEHVSRVLELRTQLEEYTKLVEDTRQRLETARQAALTAQTAATKAQFAAENAAEALAGYMKADGSLKGFSLFGLRSPGRRAAENSKSAFERASAEMQRAEYDLQLKSNEVERHKTTVEECETKLAMYSEKAAHISASYGADATLSDAEKMISHTVNLSLQRYTLEQLKTMYYEDASITQDEYRAALTAKGEEASLEELEHENEQEAGRYMDRDIEI